jgi:putative salt-induced outer membrane protein YdiY
MNRFGALLFGWILACLFSLPASVQGGEVVLKNGDRLTGRLVKLEEGKLALATDYAGDLQLEWAQVTCLSTDREHEFRLSDDTIVRGKAHCIEQGVIEVRQSGAEGFRRLALSDLAAVNPPPKTRYKGNLTAGGSASSGNTDARSLYGSGRLEVRSVKQRVPVSAKGNYTESEDTVTARNASGSAKYDYFLTEKLFAYAQTLLEQDRLQDLDLRSTVGGGFGYQFFDTSRIGLYAEAGASYVKEDYEEAENRSYASGRWSVGFNWQILPDRLTFFHLHEGYVSLEDAEDFYIRSEQGIQLPLIDHFFCNIQVDYDYKHRPAPGKEKGDLRYMLGLGYSFSNP